MCVGEPNEEVTDTALVTSFVTKRVVVMDCDVDPVMRNVTVGLTLSVDDCSCDKVTEDERVALSSLVAVVEAEISFVNDLLLDPS